MKIHDLKEMILKEPNQNLEVCCDSLEDIINISKLYTPEYPIKENIQGGGEVYRCPHCGIMLEAVKDVYEPKFCHNCGKAFKWKEINND